MAFMSSMNVVGSALTAEMLRLDVISENITNINTTRTEGGGPYRRKVVVLEEQGERMGCSPVRLRPDAVALRWVFRRTDVRLITSVLLCPICRDCYHTPGRIYT